MKLAKCSKCGKLVPSTIINIDGRCLDCLQQEGVWICEFCEHVNKDSLEYPCTQCNEGNKFERNIAETLLEKIIFG